MVSLRILMRFSLPLLLTGCSILQRHPESGYADDSKGRSGWKKIGSSQNSFVQETRFNETTQRLKLKILENSLSTRQELEQYTKALPLLKDDQEKLDFLEAGGFEEKQRWLKDEGVYERNASNKGELDKVAESQDIALGMNEQLVVRAWGEPDGIEASGQARFRNQKWRYVKQIATTDGFFTEKRYVYFEGGRVIGWEKE